MANKRFCLGILALALIFGMTVAGCDDGNNKDSGINLLDVMGLSAADPSAADLSMGDITLAQFNEVKALLGGYQGWSTFDGALNIIWTGRTLAQAMQAHDDLDDLPWASGKFYEIWFFPTREDSYGFYVPAGTVWASFW